MQNQFEYLECLAAKDALKKSIFEDKDEKNGSLDVLAQHINGVACSNSFKAFELLRGPSKIKFPAVVDLLVKRLSSSVVDKIPLVIIGTPADILEL